ncbi:hypothetical protein [Dictyobacter formicarum]|uniref:Uncharacterized protein n=1 Tax=Dictyobacter formicarum TaxID=2778368 RepID=A0ABQ3VW81_9CHLR|nr:hypothetical protein [Dictyobacter formicarum]GHO89296.1 hypothetical protein KSZ_73020 [Dictyobacter formicarum]
MFGQKGASGFSLAENPAGRKIFFWAWHILLFMVIILLLVFWQSSLWLLGCAGDFSRLMEKIEIVLFVLLLTSPLTRTLRQRLFPRNSPPRM